MPLEIRKAEVLDEFLDRLTESGFGALSKKETDRLVFSLLVQTGRIGRLDSHFEISRLLKISITKARSLVYEYKLHTCPRMTAGQLREEFASLLSVSRFGKTKDRIVLEVRDTRVREEFEELIHSDALGCAPDYSFNKNLLLIDFDTFSALVENLAGEEHMRKVEKELRKLKDLPQGLPSGRALLGKFLEGAASRAGQSVVDLAGLLVTGGITTAVSNLLAIETINSNY